MHWAGWVHTFSILFVYFEYVGFGHSNGAGLFQAHKSTVPIHFLKQNDEFSIKKPQKYFKMKYKRIVNNLTDMPQYSP